MTPIQSEKLTNLLSKHFKDFRLMLVRRKYKTYKSSYFDAALASYCRLPNNYL